MAYVRVCGGAGWVTIGSTRQPTPDSGSDVGADAIGRGSPRAFGARVIRSEAKASSTLRWYTEPCVGSERIHL